MTSRLNGWPRSFVLAFYSFSLALYQHSFSVFFCCVLLFPRESNAYCKGHIIKIDSALVDTCYIDDVNFELLYTACVNKLYVMFCYVKPVDCVLSVWGKIMIPMYRLWLHVLYGIDGPRCPLSKKSYKLNDSPITPIEDRYGNYVCVFFVLVTFADVDGRYRNSG